MTAGGKQFVAFYDDRQRMTMGVRTLGADRRRLPRLPSEAVWESHNHVAMAADDDGCLHPSRNMRVKPLNYSRPAKPRDIESCEGIHKTTGAEETRCTDPRSFRGARKEPIFTWRDGKSGNGNQIHNVHGLKAWTWRRLPDRPLTGGQGRMNACLHGPAPGRDSSFHLMWVRPDTPDCATNHDLAYARIRDLVRWETSAGKALEPRDLARTVEC